MKFHHYLIGIVAVLIISGGLYLLFTADDSAQGPEANNGAVDNNGTEPVSDDQAEVPVDWEQYQNPQFDLTFQYPSEGAATVEAGQVKITYLGPNNTQGSEITDGFTFFVRLVETNGRTIADLATEQFEEDSTDLEVVSEVAEVERFSREAYSYQLETVLGPTVTHTLLETENGQFFETRYMISGDQDGTYQQIVDLMINSLDPDAASSGHDESDTETVSIALLDLEYEGEPDRGCDQVVMVDREIPATTMPLTGALNELFGLKDTDVDGYHNFMANTNDTLVFNSVTIDEGTATVSLSGELSGLVGVCDDPRARIQIEETALQFDTVDEVEIILNGQSTDLQPSQQ